MADRTIQILIETAVQGTERVQNAANAADDLARSQRDAGEAAGEAGESFGKAGETAGKLGGGLELVGVQGAQVVADLADVGEVAAQALEGASGAVMALVGALAVLAAAYAVTQRGVERINAQHALEKTLAGELRDSYRALEDAQQATALATGELTDAQDAELTVRREIQRAVQDALTAHTEEKKALQEQISDTQKYIDAQRGLAIVLVTVQNLAGGWASTLARATAQGVPFKDIIQQDIRELNGMLDAVTGLESGVAAAQEQIRTFDGAARDQVETIKKTGEETLKADRATRSQADAQAVLTERLQATADAHAASVAAMDEDAAAQAAFRAQLGQLTAARDAANRAMLTGADAIKAGFDEELAALEEIYQQTVLNATSDQDRADANQAYTDARSAGLARQAIELEKFHADEAARIETERQQAIQAELDKAAAAKQAKLDQVTGAGSALQGGLTGILSQAGPIGAIVAMVVQLVTSIVDETGNGLIDQIHEAAMEFFNDLSGLGPELASSMIRSVEEGIPALFKGIGGLIEGLLSPESIQQILVGSVEMIPTIVGSLIELLIVQIPEVAAEFVKTILSPETWIEAGRMLVDGIKGNFGESSLFGQDATFKSTAGAILTGGLSTFVGSFDQTTDYVPKTGLALVHEGEKISRGGGGRERMGGGDSYYFGGGMLIGTVDDLARKVAEYQSGRGSTWGPRY